MQSSMVFTVVIFVLELIVQWFQLFIWRLLVYKMRPVVNQFFFGFLWFSSGTKSNFHGSKWRKMSRIHDLACRIDVVLNVALWSKGRADWSWKLYWKYKLFYAQFCTVLIWKLNIFVNSCNIWQILRHFLGCICVILCQIFTVHNEGSEK